MKELIHKNCGGRIFISVSEIEGLGEGYCEKCNKTIDCREQIDWEKSTEKDIHQQHKEAPIEGLAEEGLTEEELKEYHRVTSQRRNK